MNMKARGIIIETAFWFGVFVLLVAAWNTFAGEFTETQTNRHGRPVEITHHPVGFAGVKEACKVRHYAGCSTWNSDLSACDIWYYRHDARGRRHEERHCREGSWHL